MDICVQHAVDSNMPDIKFPLMGVSPGCAKCHGPQELVIQEGANGADHVTAWWYCTKCFTTAPFRVEGSLFV